MNNNSVFESEVDRKISWSKSFGVFILELVRIVIISLVIIIPVRYFLIQPFYVKGASMEPNFFNNEYLVIDEISYRFKDPTRGEIIVFRYPRDPKQYFIKRIIGLPGEKIEVKEGSVFIDDVKLDESEYLSLGLKTDKDNIWVLKDNEYFMLGDNRNYSLDSRSFGPVDEKYMIGRAWVRGWPFNRITVFEPPFYNENN